MSTTPLYTPEILRQMKGQAVKDIWHAMIGKPAGIKNTTGLRNSEEIIQAIVKGQEDHVFLETFGGRGPKPKPEASVEDRMPPKKKPGPKPKIQLSLPAPIKRSGISAIESSNIPLQALEVIRRRVRKLHIGDTSYFLDIHSNELFSVMENKPGNLVGKWNPEERVVIHLPEV